MLMLECRQCWLSGDCGACKAASLIGLVRSSRANHYVSKVNNVCFFFKKTFFNILYSILLSTFPIFLPHAEVAEIIK